MTYPINNNNFNPPSPPPKKKEKSTKELKKIENHWLSLRYRHINVNEV